MKLEQTETSDPERCGQATLPVITRHAVPEPACDFCSVLMQAPRLLHVTLDCRPPMPLSGLRSQQPGMLLCAQEHAIDTHECYTCGRPLSNAELNEFNDKQVWPASHAACQERPVSGLSARQTTLRLHLPLCTSCMYVCSKNDTRQHIDRRRVARCCAYKSCLHVQDLEVAELPERKRETATLERTLKQQLSSLRQLQPVFSRLQDLDGSIVPAAQRKAEVGLHPRYPFLMCPMAAEELPMVRLRHCSCRW